jgi:beta-N-acetylhexosaminidase
MNLRQKIGQCLMVGIRGTSLDEESRFHLRDIAPGGVILFSRNISSPAQARKLIAEIREVVQPSPLIAIDQEGGLVIRFFRDVAVMPGNMALGAAANPKWTFEVARLMAQELKEIGFDLNLAPVVDVVSTYDNPGITIRSFGSDPEKVAALGGEFVRGTQTRRIGAVAKHFPGKGGAAQDAHFELPVVSVSPEEMRGTHIYPFATAIAQGVSGIMSSHVVYRSFGTNDDLPATFAKHLITGLLREEMGFQGVMFSDDMEMGAISRYFSFDEAVVNAVRAGHDMVLVCSDAEKQRVAAASLENAYRQGSLMELDLDHSVERIERLRRFCLEPAGGGQLRHGEGARIAREVVESAVTLIRGEVPVPLSRRPNERILAIMPDLASLESVEEGFEAGEGNFIMRLIEERIGTPIQKQFFAIDPGEEEIGRIWEEAKLADLVFAFIFNARYLKGQLGLLEKLRALPDKVVFLLIRNPFDLEFLGPNLTTLITYGYRKVQLAAAVKVLAGEIPALGKLPFERSTK